MPSCFSRLSNKFSKKKDIQDASKANDESKASSAGKEPLTNSGTPGDESPKKQSPFPKDRWRDAFEQLSADSQEILKEMGFNNLRSGDMEASIKDLIGTVEEKQKVCEKDFWKVEVGGKEIVFREYTDQIVG